MTLFPVYRTSLIFYLIVKTLLRLPGLLSKCHVVSFFREVRLTEGPGDVATIDPYLSDIVLLFLSPLPKSQQQRLSKIFRARRHEVPGKPASPKKNLILYKLHVILNIFRGLEGRSPGSPNTFFLIVYIFSQTVLDFLTFKGFSLKIYKNSNINTCV